MVLHRRYLNDRSGYSLIRNHCSKLLLETAPAVKRGHHRHRAMAWPREPGNDPYVRRGGYQNAGGASVTSYFPILHVIIAEEAPGIEMLRGMVSSA